jgi:hypothetical protein
MKLVVVLPRTIDAESADFVTFDATDLDTGVSTASGYQADPPRWATTGIRYTEREQTITFWKDLAESAGC